MKRFVRLMFLGVAISSIPVLQSSKPAQSSTEQRVDPGVFLSPSAKQEILKVRGEKAFAMEANLTCTVVLSTDATRKGYMFRLSNMYAPVLTELTGQGLTMAQNVARRDSVALRSDRETMSYTKIDETREGVTMIAFTFSGLETLVVDKGNGFFARSFAGVLQGPFGYLYLGYCS